MSNEKRKVPRRRFLRQCAQGTATGMLVAATAGRLFAEQFLRAAPTGEAPEADYDPTLQVLVDRQTRQPIYTTAWGGTRYREWPPIVTPGPKGDGKWDYYND